MARFVMVSLMVWLWATPAAAAEARPEVRVHLVSDAPLLELRRVAQHFVGMGYGYRGPTVGRPTSAPPAWSPRGSAFPSSWEEPSSSATT
jgi:hypothetical protein